MSKQKQPEDRKTRIRKGFAYGCKAHLVAVVGMLLIGAYTSSAIGESVAVALTILFVFFIGMSQLSYMIPLLILAKLQQRDAEFFEGLIFSGGLPIVVSVVIYTTLEAGLWRISL